MSVRGARLLAGAAIATVVASAAWVLTLDATTTGGSLWLPIGSFTTVGGLIASLRPRNPIGWLFLAVAVLWATGTFALDYAVEIYSHGDESKWATAAAWYAEWYWLPAISLVGIFNAFLFPTGRLHSRRWRPVFFLAALAIGASTVLAALDPHLEPSEGLRVSNPVGISPFGDVEEGVFGGILGSCLAGFATAAMISLLLRFRRSRGEELQQLKWFAYAGALLVLGWFVWIPLEEVLEGVGNAGYAVLLTLPPIAAGIAILRYRLYDIDVVINRTLVYSSLSFIPISVGIAILRYRLYDIDVLINRTLVYGSLSVLLALSYLGGVVVVGAALRTLTAREDELAVAASTLAVAALVGPARRRVQAFIDRRFYRSRYDAARTLEAFTRRLRDEVDLEVLRIDLLGVVGDTVRPSHASVWLRR